MVVKLFKASWPPLLVGLKWSKHCREIFISTTCRNSWSYSKRCFGYSWTGTRHTNSWKMLIVATKGFSDHIITQVRHDGWWRLLCWSSGTATLKLEKSDMCGMLWLGFTKSIYEGSKRLKNHVSHLLHELVKVTCEGSKTLVRSPDAPSLQILNQFFQLHFYHLCVSWVASLLIWDCMLSYIKAFKHTFFHSPSSLK